MDTINIIIDSEMDAACLDLGEDGRVTMKLEPPISLVDDWVMVLEGCLVMGTTSRSSDPEEKPKGYSFSVSCDQIAPNTYVNGRIQRNIARFGGTWVGKNLAGVTRGNYIPSYHLIATSSLETLSFRIEPTLLGYPEMKRIRTLKMKIKLVTMLTYIKKSQSLTIAPPPTFQKQRSLPPPKDELELENTPTKQNGTSTSQEGGKDIPPYIWGDFYRQSE
jgi:hypothetical protein